MQAGRPEASSARNAEQQMSPTLLLSNQGKIKFTLIAMLAGPCLQRSVSNWPLVNAHMESLSHFSNTHKHLKDKKKIKKNIQMLIAEWLRCCPIHDAISDVYQAVFG